MRNVLLSLCLLPCVGCSGDVGVPPSRATQPEPYRQIRVVAERSGWDRNGLSGADGIIEVDYGGITHVFLRSNYHGSALAKIGEYPIALPGSVSPPPATTPLAPPTSP